MSAKPGRNEPCACGSGRKHKHCCGAVQTAEPGTAALSRADIGALVALVNQERLTEAEQASRRLLARHPDTGMLWKILGVTLLRQGRDALQALRTAADLLPDDAEAHANLGAALNDREDWAAALTSLRRALAIQPDAVDVLVDAADATKALGRAREAVALYERALERNPRLPEALNNLGNAWLELHDFAAAVACYERAREIDGGNAQVHNNLALAQAALGRREAAAVSLRQALEIYPRFVDALNNLGNVLRELGDVREAMTLYTRAVELDATRAESHCNLGNALFELRHIEAAQAAYRRALELRPDHVAARVGLGSVLRRNGRLDDAEAMARAMLAVDPGNIGALSLLAELATDRGNFREAELSFRQVIDLDPDNAYAFFSIASQRKLTVNDGAWLRGAEALLKKTPTLGSEIDICYALGKYHDDVRNYDRAFAHYRQANELTKRFGAVYDGEKLVRHIDRIVGDFDAAFPTRVPAAASSSTLPVFIIGMPRSGTSLAEQILASHPAVFGAGEVTFWDDAFAAYQRAGGAGTPAGAALLGDLARDYLARVSVSSGGAVRVVDKMPANFLYAGLIHAVFPQARILHMRRHPWDTCLSVYFQNFSDMGAYANDLDSLAHYYAGYRRITDHWSAIIPATAWLDVPYESLVADQERWTRRMVDFVGLPWDRSCLEFNRTNRVVITSSKWQVRQKLHASSAGRWRNYEKFVGPLRHLTLPAAS